MFPAIPLDQPPTPNATSLAVAYDLVAALAADDLAGVNQALPNTSAVQVAVVAIVLAKGPPISDLHNWLQLLALHAEIDAIETTEEGSARERDRDRAPATKSRSAWGDDRPMA
jgi:hypothetical protein